VGKGSQPRPTLISSEESRLRWALAYGDISRVTFKRRMAKLEKEGKIYRK
jgi:hypothetical protein